MKILHVVQAYHPAIGGSEWLTKNLSEHLVSGYGDEVTVFTTNAYRTEVFWRGKGPLMPVGIEEINGVTVRRFKVFGGLQRIRELLARGSHRLRLPYNGWLRTIQTGPIVLDMTSEIARSGAQVVLATAFPFLHMHYALAGARRAGVPVVLLGSIHAADTWGYDRKPIYRAIRQADAYVALTAFERDYVAKKGVPEARVAVIGAGVDVNAFDRAEGAAIRERYGWGDRLVVGAVARQSALKRLDILVEAMSRVWDSRPEAQLMLAGAKGSHTPLLERMIAALPPDRQARITIINDFPEGEKPSLIAACDLVAHPSGNESFGIVFVEAWACAKPVIGARVGAIPSVIDDGQDGLLCDYLDAGDMARAILALLGDRTRRDQMGQAGYDKVVKTYTWEVVTGRLRAVYEKVLHQG